MKTRIISFDILRIVCMLMIATMHILTIGNLIDVNMSFYTVNYLVGSFANSCCLVAVNVFVLLSSYFYKDFYHNIKKLLSLWIIVFFYSLSIYLVFCGLKICNFSVNELIGYCMPVISTKYWFFTAYFAMQLFVPIVERGVEVIDSSGLRLTIIICVIFFVLIPTIFRSDIFFMNNGYSAVFFIFLFIIGRYYVKTESSIFNLPILSNCRWLFFFYFLFSIIGFVIYISDFHGYKCVVSNYTSLSTFLASLCLFRGCMLLRINSNNSFCIVTRKISKLIFSVYLIHMHPLIRHYLLENMFFFFQNVGLMEFVIILIISPFLCLLVCIFIDYFRNIIFDMIKSSYIITKGIDILERVIKRDE